MASTTYNPVTIPIIVTGFIQGTHLNVTFLHFHHSAMNHVLAIYPETELKEIC